MATIDSLEVNQAYDMDLEITGALNCSITGSATLRVDLNVDGAIYSGMAKAYTEGFLTWNFYNGSLFTLDISAGTWIYTRPPAETEDLIMNTYNFSFTLIDESGTAMKSAMITTEKSVDLKAVTIQPAMQTDTVINGSLDYFTLDYTGVSLKVDVIVDTAQYLTGSSEAVTESGISKFKYSDGSSLTFEARTGTWSYTRKSVIDNTKTNNYNFIFTLNRGSESGTVSATIVTTIHYLPEIQQFSALYAVDTDSVLEGNISINNLSIDGKIQVNTKVNGRSFLGSSKVTASMLHWEYEDGSSFLLNTEKGSWTYTRLISDVGNYADDTYEFEVVISDSYGTDKAKTTAKTIVEGPKILSFSAASVLDSSQKITGILQLDIPKVHSTVSIGIGVTANGTAYTVPEQELGNSTLTFSYEDKSSLVFDPVTGAWTYTRNPDDVQTPTPDIYIFSLIAKCNNKVANAELTLKTLAGQRIYNYEPAYPIQVEPGSNERQNRAWPKAKLEFERIYRLFNENMNYYEEMFQNLNNTVTDLSKELDEKIKNLTQLIDSICPIGNTLIWSVKTPPPEIGGIVWHECDGSKVDSEKYPDLYKIMTTLPDYRGIFLRGQGSVESKTSYGTTSHKSGELGVLQPDAIRNMTGSIRATDNCEWDILANGVFSGQSVGSGDSGGHKGELKVFTFNASRVVQTANENRPINKAVKYFIRMK